MNKIALFGGTFNPPHAGHVAACRAFVKAVCPDVLYIMPSALPPHKEISGADVPAHRFCMARMAFENMGCDTVFSAMELARSGKSYTVDTINELIKIHGCEKVYLYVGSDMLFCFEKWKDFLYLFEKCVLVTAARSTEDEAVIRQCCENYREKYGCSYILMPIEPLDISSTELRNMLKHAANDFSCQKECKKYLTEKLYGYIMKSDIYGEKPCCSDITSDALLQRIRKELLSQIDESRLAHTYGVEQTALEMAKIFLPLYGYDKSYLADISAAALLHDFTKCKSDMWHEDYLKGHMRGYKGYNAVYHSWSAAYFALQEYHVNPRVFRAVYSHTTGRAGMDIFEKIIFLADYIEPGRRHSSCIELRKKYYDLINQYSGNAEKLKALPDELILESLENTKAHLALRGAAICPVLYETVDFIKNSEVTK